jgi:hypothetical protein
MNCVDLNPKMFFFWKSFGAVLQAIIIFEQGKCTLFFLYTQRGLTDGIFLQHL